MKHPLRVAVWSMLGALALAVLPLQSIRASELTPWACIVAVIQGSYEFVAPVTVSVGPGTVIAIPERLLDSSPAPYARNGRLIFSGAGEVRLEAVEDINGVLDTPVTIAGVYRLNTDCTAAVLFDNGMQLGLRIVDNGTAVFLVSTTPGFVLLRPALPSAVP